jgi:hypothetical protein
MASAYRLYHILQSIAKMHKTRYVGAESRLRLEQERECPARRPVAGRYESTPCLPDLSYRPAPTEKEVTTKEQPLPEEGLPS